MINELVAIIYIIRMVLDNAFSERLFLRTPPEGCFFKYYENDKSSRFYKAQYRFNNLSNG